MRIVQYFISLCVPILLVIGSVRLVMMPFFLTFEYTREGFPVDFYGFSTEDRLKYGFIGIDYLLNGEGIEFLERQRLPIDLCWNVPLDMPDCAMFNDAELRHMQDVKWVMTGSFGLGLIFLMGFIGSVIFLWRKRTLAVLWRGLLWGAFLTLMSIITLVIVAVVAWDVFFDTFHRLLFEEGTWRFLYSDTLIRLYPEQFWFDASLVVGGMTLMGTLGLGGWSWLRLRSA